MAFMKHEENRYRWGSPLPAAKVLVFALAVLIGATSLVACGGSNDKTSTDTAAKKYEEVMIIGVNRAPYQSLDPIVEGVSVTIHRAVYDTLLIYDKAGEFAPSLAKSWSSSKDGKTWTFELVEGAMFHDGTPVDSEAVKYSILENKKRAPGAYIWTPVKSIDTPTPTTVVVKCEYSYPIDVAAASPVSAFIVSPKAVKKYGDNAYQAGYDAGSGPYTLKSATQTEVQLERFDGYFKGWEGSHANAPRLAVVRHMPETAVRVQNVEQGVCALVDQVPPSNFDSLLARDPHLKGYPQPSPRKVVHFFNTASGPCTDKNLRLALYYACPYEEGIDLVFSGYANPSHGVIQAGVPGFDEQNERFAAPTQDLEKAKEYLAKSAYADGVKLVVRRPQGDTISEQADTLFQAAVAPLGIELDVKAVQSSTMFDQAQADEPPQDILTTGWAPYMNWAPDNFQSTYMPNSYWNISKWTSPEVTKLVEDATATYAKDQSAAINQLLDAWQLILDGASSAYIADIQTTPVATEKLEGFEGFSPLEYMCINIYDLALRK